MPCRPIQPRLTIWLFCLAGLTCGCGGGNDGALKAQTVYEVKGKVLLGDGKPLKGGHVFFVHKDGAFRSEGKIAEDGTFTLETGGSGEGARPETTRSASNPPT